MQEDLRFAGLQGLSVAVAWLGRVAACERDLVCGR